jgi:hypothetical protein
VNFSSAAAPAGLLVAFSALRSSASWLSRCGAHPLTLIHTPKTLTLATSHTGDEAVRVTRSWGSGSRDGFALRWLKRLRFPAAGGPRDGQLARGAGDRRERRPVKVSATLSLESPVVVQLLAPGRSSETLTLGARLPPWSLRRSAGDV